MSGESDAHRDTIRRVCRGVRSQGPARFAALQCKGQSCFCGLDRRDMGYAATPMGTGERAAGCAALWSQAVDDAHERRRPPILVARNQGRKRRNVHE